MHHIVLTRGHCRFTEGNQSSADYTEPQTLCTNYILHRQPSPEQDLKKIQSNKI